MKNLFLIIVVLFTFIALSTKAQVMDGINYQAVAVDANGKEIAGMDIDGNIIPNKAIMVQFTIIADDINGEMVYQETHEVNTDMYGMFALVIGHGLPTGESPTEDFAAIDWMASAHFLKVEVDLNNSGTYTLSGIQQLMAVPYALHANTAANVFSGDYNDLSNAPDSISHFANDVGYLTNPDDADADPTNEFQSLDFDGNILSITDGTGTDLSVLYDNTDMQTLSTEGHSVTISNGNTILLNVDDADADTSNELQNLSLSANQLGISDGNTVDLSGYLDNTDNQDISLVNNQLSIENGNTVDLSAYAVDNDNQTLSVNGDAITITNGNTVLINDDVDDADANPTNELQNLSLIGNQIAISSGNSIDLSFFLDNTDEQALTINGNQLSISNGNTVTLTDNIDDADADPTNEIQNLSLAGNQINISGGNSVDLSFFLDNTDEQALSVNGNQLSISNGNTVTLTDNVDDADANPTNELQNLSLTGTELSISNGNNINLAGLQDGTGTDDQTLSLNANTLSIENGNAVDLGIYIDNTDSQLLSITGDDITISNGNTITINDDVDDADADPANEIQSLSLSNDSLYLSQSNAVDLSWMSEPDFIIVRNQDTVNFKAGHTVLFEGVLRSGYVEAGTKTMSIHDLDGNPISMNWQFIFGGHDTTTTPETGYSTVTRTTTGTITISGTVDVLKYKEFKAYFTPSTDFKGIITTNDNGFWGVIRQ
jgi:hypothetical protein